MSSYFQTVVKIIVFLPLVLILSAAGCQRSKQPEVSVTVNPPEATVRNGQTQSFTAVAEGTPDGVGIRWGVQEQDGGRISDDGVYTAPKVSGIYHVVATSEANPPTRVVAKVTVIGDGLD